MWPEDDEVEAALRGDNAINPAADVNWARIWAGAAVLFFVGLAGVIAAVLSQPA